MGKLKSFAGDILKTGSNLFGDMKQGSYAIAEKLGYQKAGLSPKSNATLRAEAAAQPKVMPMPDEEALQATKRKSLISQLGRTGRASTILSDPTDRLGP